MLFRLLSSASSVDNSWVRAEGFCRREVNSWCVLIICLVNSFHCFSMFPNDTWAVIIQEWWVGYAFNTGWNSIDSLFSHVVLMSVIMHAMLERRWVQGIYMWLCTGVKLSSSICKCNSWQIHGMVDISSCLAKLHVNVPQFYWWFKYYIFNIAWSCFSGSLIFYLKVMSIALNTDNSISRPPFQVPLSWLFTFEVYSVTYLEWWWFSVCCFLSSSEVVFI